MSYQESTFAKSGKPGLPLTDNIFGAIDKANKGKTRYNTAL